MGLAAGTGPTRSRAIALTSLAASNVFFLRGKHPPHRIAAASPGVNGLCRNITLPGAAASKAAISTGYPLAAITHSRGLAASIRAARSPRGIPIMVASSTATAKVGAAASTSAHAFSVPPAVTTYIPGAADTRSSSSAGTVRRRRSGFGRRLLSFEYFNLTLPPRRFDGPGPKRVIMTVLGERGVLERKRRSTAFPGWRNYETQHSGLPDGQRRRWRCPPIFPSNRWCFISTASASSSAPARSAPGESARLDFNAAEMNDVLKSLTIEHEAAARSPACATIPWIR